MSSKNTLADLISHGLVRAGDSLYFTFKKHTFHATLEPGGIIANCTVDMRPCFIDRAGFSSLTDWCDTCIQEILEEYATRFSGWKRCKHQATGSTMAMLRQQLHGMKPAKKQVLQADLLAEQQKVVMLRQRVRQLEMQLAQPAKKARVGVVPGNPFRL